MRACSFLVVTALAVPRGASGSDAAALPGDRARVWEPAFPATVGLVTRGARTDLVFREQLETGVLLGPVAFGSPLQPAQLALDLALSDAVVLNHEIPEHRIHQYYNHSQSSSYVRNGTHVSIDFGLIEGFTSRDTITVGSNGDAIAAPNVLFVEMEHVPVDVQTHPMDGIISLAFHDSTSTGMPSFMRQLIDGGALAEPIVGVRLSDVGAHVTLGGIDTSVIVGRFSYVDALRAHGAGWRLPLESVRVRGKPLPASSGVAVLSSRPFIFGPREQIDAIAALVGADHQSIPCNSPGPNIEFVFAGISVTVTKREYARDVDPKSNDCLFTLLHNDDASESDDTWFVGLPFLRTVYTALEYGAHADAPPRVGFADLRVPP